MSKKQKSNRWDTVNVPRPTINPEYLQDENEYVKGQRDMFNLGVVVGMIMGMIMGGITVFTICSLIVIFN